MAPLLFQNAYLSAAENQTPTKRKKTTEGHSFSSKPILLPLYPVPEVVLFPDILSPLYLPKKEKYINLIKEAHKKKAPLAFLLSKRAQHRHKLKNFYSIGTAATIERLVHLPDGETVAILQGQKRFQAVRLHEETQPPLIQVEWHPDPVPKKTSATLNALVESIQEVVKKLLSSSSEAPTGIPRPLQDLQDPLALIYYIASNVTDATCKQKVLAAPTLQKKGETLLDYLMQGLQFTNLKREIQAKFNQNLQEEQRINLIKNQIKHLQNELGEPDDVAQLQEKAKEKKWSKEIQTYFDRALQQLHRLSPHASEYSTYLAHLNLFLQLPWGVHTTDNTDLKHAAQVLDKTHYGMDKVKERLLEALAVHTLKKNKKGFILCLSGPPGVGKTTIASSIAEALGRKFEKISLGGVHDEATLRGHRKTYVAAMEGRIIHSLKKANSANPVILLDEIDKIDKSRGHLDAVLMEILDPSQNQHFKDNYLEAPFDLSEVLFIATANDPNAISPPLRDRMEVIELGGYALEEKAHIARRHLLPQQLEEVGLAPVEATFTPAGLTHLIEAYTSESGVRELNRKISALVRKVAKKKLEKAPYPTKLGSKEIRTLLGAPEHHPELQEKPQQPGVAIGLAWTEVGGCILFIEALLYPGEGKVTLSGQLGDVMEESALAAHSYLKANSEKLHIDPKAFKDYDLHIHLTPAATPKDGPSAGITLFAAMASLYTQRKIKPSLAMSGEIAFRGVVLPVGGVKEKVLAARRANIKEIILSAKNKKDVEEIDPRYRKNLTFHFLTKVDQLIPLALEKPTNTPTPPSKTV